MMLTDTDDRVNRVKTNTVTEQDMREIIEIAESKVLDGHGYREPAEVEIVNQQLANNADAFIDYPESEPISDEGRLLQYFVEHENMSLEDAKKLIGV